MLLGPDRRHPARRSGLGARLRVRGRRSILGDTPRGTRAADAAPRVRLVLLANDITLRNLVPGELAKGFGFFQSKPATAFSPFAVTPDELGDAWRDGRVHLPLRTISQRRARRRSRRRAEMHFSFFDLIAHVARTRGFTAGTILGSGTVSNADRARGVSCLAERRAIEMIDGGKPLTPFMAAGDAVAIEMLDRRRARHLRAHRAAGGERMILYDYWRSSSAWRVRIALNLKGIPVRTAGGEPGAKDERRAAQRRVPRAEPAGSGAGADRRRPRPHQPFAHHPVDGDPRSTSRSAFPRRRCCPRDPALRARARQLAEIVNAGIQPLQNLALLERRAQGGRSATPAAVAREFIARGLAALEAVATETAGTFLVGDAPTHRRRLPGSAALRGPPLRRRSRGRPRR